MVESQTLNLQNGKIMVKDNNDVIYHIQSQSDLTQFATHERKPTKPKRSLPVRPEDRSKMLSFQTGLPYDQPYPADPMEDVDD